jgi:hypothetical protein
VETDPGERPPLIDAAARRLGAYRRGKHAPAARRSCSASRATVQTVRCTPRLLHRAHPRTTGFGEGLQMVTATLRNPKGVGWARPAGVMSAGRRGSFLDVGDPTATHGLSADRSS